MRLPKVMADFDAFWASHIGEGDKAPTMSAWVDQDREDAEGRSNVGRATCGPGVVLGVLDMGRTNSAAQRGSLRFVVF
ncbi:hypothetical protein E1A91_A06G059400v1 [Gossypium mustelinum]|uniref:Uncharacterized protein n=1 Tax=Gossypium mustelinum TaxID=34275 RepID=A0A5D2YTS4_GOSMU|nr:hypothetical protein E1A91_A06G059400v1 [Gossypium mustelinum]